MTEHPDWARPAACVEYVTSIGRSRMRTPATIKSVSPKGRVTLANGEIFTAQQLATDSDGVVHYRRYDRTNQRFIYLYARTENP